MFASSLDHMAGGGAAHFLLQAHQNVATRENFHRESVEHPLLEVGIGPLSRFVAVLKGEIAVET